MAIAAGNEGHRNSTIVTEATGQGEVINTSFTPPSHMRENIFIGCSTTSAFHVTLSLVGSDGVAFETSISSMFSESVSHENITGEKDYSLVTLSPMKDADGLQRGVSINLYAPLKDGQKWNLSVTGAAGKYIACCDYGELDNGSNASTMAATRANSHIGGCLCVARQVYQFTRYGTKFRLDCGREVSFPVWDPI